MPLVVANLRLPISTILAAALGCVIVGPLLADAVKVRLDPLGLKAVVTYAMVYFFLAPVVDLVLVLDPTAALDLDPTLMQYGYFGPMEVETLNRSILIVLAGIVAFWFGFRLPKRSKAVDKALSHRDHWTPGALWRTGVVFIAMGLIAVVVEIIVIGGWGQWVSATWHNRREGRYDDFFNYLNMLTLLLVPGCFMLLVAAIRQGYLVMWASTMSLIAGVVFTLILQGARRHPMGILLGLMVVWHLGRSRLKTRTVIVLLLAGVLSVILLLPVRTSLGYIGLLELPAHSLETASQIQVGTLVREATEMIGGFDSLLVLVKDVPSRVEPLWGSTYLKLLVFPVPRSVWPEKPAAFTEIIAALFYPSIPNLSITATIVGEAYFNFLLPGVLGTMVVIGMALRRLDDWALSFPSDSLRLVLHGIVIVMSFEVFRGPLSILITYSFQLIAVMFVNRVLASARSS